MQHLQSIDTLQSHLLVPMSAEQQDKRESLMQTIDQLNRRYGRGSVHWAACGLEPGWAMRRDQLSRAATTRLRDIPVVQA
jgi:DNA polymerase V